MRYKHNKAFSASQCGKTCDPGAGDSGSISSKPNTAQARSFPAQREPIHWLQFMLTPRFCGLRERERERERTLEWQHCELEIAGQGVWGGGTEVEPRDDKGAAVTGTRAVSICADVSPCPHLLAKNGHKKTCAPRIGSGWGACQGTSTARRQAKAPGSSSDNCL